MDASGLLRLTCAINAFGARGDSGPAPLAAGARSAATKAAGFLTRRLVFAHLRGDGLVLDLAGLLELAGCLDELVALGDGLKTGLTGAEVVTLWTLRLEIQQRMRPHPDGDALARGLDLSPLGQAAWEAAEAAAAGGAAEAAHWPPRPAVPAAPPPAAPRAAPAAPPPVAPAAPLAAAVETRPVEPAAAVAIAPEPSGPAGTAGPQEVEEEEAEGAGGAPAADKPRASLGLFSRAILRLHDAVESIAPPPRPEGAEEPEPAQAEPSVRHG